MKRDLVLSLVLVAAVAADAHAQCRVKFNNAYISAVSHGFWRGIDLGKEAFIEPRVELGICGRPSTELGNSGVDANVEGWASFAGDTLNVASAQVRWLRYFGSSKQAQVALGFRESHFGGRGSNEWSGEVTLDAHTDVNIPRGDFNFTPFVEIDRDLHLFDATFARAGVNSPFPYHRLKVDAMASVAGSNYADDFGWHDTEVSVWADYRLIEVA